MQSKGIDEMIEKAIMEQMIKEFFDKQTNKGLENRFINHLSDDLEVIVKDFNDYIVKKNLELDSGVNRVNFHDALKMIIDEVCAFKIETIKYHHRTLSESADIARASAIR